MKPSDCPKRLSCDKLLMILDKDILDFQATEAISGVCGRCETPPEAHTVPTVEEQLSTIFGKQGVYFSGKAVEVLSHLKGMSAEEWSDLWGMVDGKHTITASEYEGEVEAIILDEHLKPGCLGDKFVKRATARIMELPRIRHEG